MKQQPATWEDEQRMVTLVKLLKGDPIKRQFGKKTTICHFPMFANAQAEFDSMNGCLPLFGSVVVDTNKRKQW